MLLGLSAVAVTGISLFAWLVIVLNTIFSWGWDAEWVYTGFALPAAGVGALSTQLTRRRAYLWAGLVITLVPLVACLLLAATAPTPPLGWNAD